MIGEAERFIGGIPSRLRFLEGEKPVQPALDALGEYQRRARGGVWPSSAEISSAMLERYGGGGHARVGAISFEPGAIEKARMVAAEIVEELKR